MKYPDKGDKVSFRFDRRADGSGTVCQVHPGHPPVQKCFEVELDAPCKEFVVGDKVIVWLEEITACPA